MKKMAIAEVADRPSFKSQEPLCLEGPGPITTVLGSPSCLAALAISEIGFLVALNTTSTVRRYKTPCTCPLAKDDGSLPT